jgi:hypothetical protein
VIAFTPVNEEIVCAVVRDIKEPSPNCPTSLRPQHETVPADSNVHVKKYPNAIAVTSLTTVTNTGPE